MAKSKDVLVSNSRRGAVSCGPVTLPGGVTKVPKKDWDEVKGHSFIEALLDDGVLEVVTEVRKSDKVNTAKSEAPKSEESKKEEKTEENPKSATADMKEKDAIAYVNKLEDETELVEIFEGDERPAVKEACEIRAAALDSLEG